MHVFAGIYYYNPRKQIDEQISSYYRQGFIMQVPKSYQRNDVSPDLLLHL